MWKVENGKLIRITETTRIKFRTTISKEVLEHLSELAKQHNTHINHLLENGLKNLLSTETISYNKKMRPKDRVQFKTTYNDELLDTVKDFAKKNELNINDVIEFSVHFIKLDKENIPSRLHK